MLSKRYESTELDRMCMSIHVYDMSMAWLSNKSGKNRSQIALTLYICLYLSVLSYIELRLEFIVVLRHMQRYFGYICDDTDVQADWRRSTYGRAPKAIDIDLFIKLGFFNVPVLHRHGTSLFIRLFWETAPFSRLLRHAVAVT